MTRGKFTKLMAHNHPFRRWLWKMALDITGGDQETARDLIQEVALAASEKLAAIRNPAAWFKRVLNNKAADWLRRECTARDHASVIASHHPEDFQDQRDCCELAKTLLEKYLLPSLSNGLREFMLKWLEYNGDMREVAFDLGMSEKVARARLSEVRSQACKIHRRYELNLQQIGGTKAIADGDGDARPPPITSIGTFVVQLLFTRGRNVATNIQLLFNRKVKHVSMHNRGDSTSLRDDNLDQRESSGIPGLLLALWVVNPSLEQWIDTGGDSRSRSDLSRVEGGNASGGIRRQHVKSRKAKGK